VWRVRCCRDTVWSEKEHGIHLSIIFQSGYEPKSQQRYDRPDSRRSTTARIVEDTTDISALKQALSAFQSQLAKLERHQERTPDRVQPRPKPTALLAQAPPESSGGEDEYAYGAYPVHDQPTFPGFPRRPATRLLDSDGD
jgi:hypothetical protein